MADERDPLVSRRYRELGSEEPPPALDEAILAASRRAAAPRRRWYLPLAAAAVALLAVGIAVQVERQRPDGEAVTAPAAPERRIDEPKALKRESVPAASDSAGDPARQERESRFGERAAEPAAVPAPIPRTAPTEPRESALADAMEESPELWLKRIAELRTQGRHEEADKALAEFRQRYPDYKVPEDLIRR